VEDTSYRYNFSIIIMLIHKTWFYGKCLSWILYRLYELMLSYEGTTSIRTQIKFKLLLKRIQREILRGPTMMIPTKIKLIKSKIDSAFIMYTGIRNMGHIYMTFFLRLHQKSTTMYILKCQMAIIILWHYYFE